MCKYIVILLSMLHKLPRAHSEPFGIIPHFNSANSCSIFEQNTFFNFIHASFIGVFLLKKFIKTVLNDLTAKNDENVIDLYSIWWQHTEKQCIKTFVDKIIALLFVSFFLDFLKTFMDIGTENKQQDKCFSL